MNNSFSGATYSENSFPSDCNVCKEVGRSPRIMTFVAALAHEISHNELDQPRAAAYDRNLFVRKYEILKRATEGHVIWKTPVYSGYDQTETKKLFISKRWWDGRGSWGNKIQEHFKSGGAGHNLDFNSIRSNLGYFVIAPQEAFATLANQYASDSKLMLDFAVERTRRGYPANMDWFFLMASYYAQGGSSIPMFRIDGDGKMMTYTAQVGRDTNGYLNALQFDSSLGLPGNLTYACTLDQQGFVVTC